MKGFFRSNTLERETCLCAYEISLADSVGMFWFGLKQWEYDGVKAVRNCQFRRVVGSHRFLHRHLFDC